MCACQEIHCNDCNQKGHTAKYYMNLTSVIKPGSNAGGNRGCYECGDVGDFKRERPKLRDQEGNGSGREFAVGTRDAINDPNVVTGTFPINNVYPSVLFDFVADKSFITPKFRELLSHKSSSLNETFVVEMANANMKVPKKY